MNSLESLIFPELSTPGFVLRCLFFEDEVAANRGVRESVLGTR